MSGHSDLKPNVRVKTPWGDGVLARPKSLQHPFWVVQLASGKQVIAHEDQLECDPNVPAPQEICYDEDPERP